MEGVGFERREGWKYNEQWEQATRNYGNYNCYNCETNYESIETKAEQAVGLWRLRWRLTIGGSTIDETNNKQLAI